MDELLDKYDEAWFKITLEGRPYIIKKTIFQITQQGGERLGESVGCHRATAALPKKQTQKNKKTHFKIIQKRTQKFTWFLSVPFHHEAGNLAHRDRKVQHTIRKHYVSLRTKRCLFCSLAGLAKMLLKIFIICYGEFSWKTRAILHTQTHIHTTHPYSQLAFSSQSTRSQTHRGDRRAQTENGCTRFNGGSNAVTALPQQQSFWIWRCRFVIYRLNILYSTNNETKNETIMRRRGDDATALFGKHARDWEE